MDDYFFLARKHEYTKALKYNKRPEMKRDAGLKAVFFPRKKLL